MLVLHEAVYDAPAVADRIVEFRNSGDLPPYCKVENLDGAASAAIRYQESDDGTTWADIAGTTATVTPGESDGQIVVSSRARIALHAGGNVQVQFGLVRQVDGAPGNLGTA